jgi:hypothetical protein
MLTQCITPEFEKTKNDDLHHPISCTKQHPGGCFFVAVFKGGLKDGRGKKCP